MAGVAKWLRQWIVVPPFAGSNPVVRPLFVKAKTNAKHPLQRWLVLGKMAEVVDIHGP